jgi:hypothetical protein
MLRSLPRRKRGLAVTIGVGGLAAVVALLTFVVLRPAKETYRPGGKVEGLTMKLARSVPDDAPRMRFKDVAREAGIDFVHFSGYRSSQLPEDMGSGAAWGDYDNDGWQDLYVANIVGPLTLSREEVAASPAHNALFHNQGDGTFEEVSSAAGVDLRQWGSGAAWGDYDNDGDIDLYVTSYGENVLFRNNGDGTFTEVTETSGVGGISSFWAGASWADYNKDGWLDLYVTGFVKYDPTVRLSRPSQFDVENPASILPLTFEPGRNLLYQNNGDGTFTETAVTAGVDNPSGRSLGAAWADFDGDGWQDLYVANYVTDNVLYRNRGDGTFKDVSHNSLVADYRSSMGLAVGDWDNDLDLDLFVTHWLAKENALFSNQMWPASPGSADPPASVVGLRFRDVADRTGLGQASREFVGWGTGFFDYDNDGRLDLLVVNGSNLQDPQDPDFMVGMRDLLFWNGGPERGFFEVSQLAGSHFSAESVGRGAAFADYDNDGDIDVLIMNHGDKAVLLNNPGNPDNHWLELSLKGAESNSQGIGARIRVVADGRVYMTEVGAQPSYLSQNSMVAHFGLGQLAAVDSIVVQWPLGNTSVRTGIEADRMYTIVEGQE